jgi:hypothetical protein
VCGGCQRLVVAMLKGSPALVDCSIAETEGFRYSVSAAMRSPQLHELGVCASCGRHQSL